MKAGGSKTIRYRPSLNHKRCRPGIGGCCFGEGESPVLPGPCRTMRRCRRVGLLGSAAPIGR
ncbi:hypothetical protein COCNU_scaffold052778G000010 [Cocos nucifera]|nr:hypothetical protein [Cocos nucifera]